MWKPLEFGVNKKTMNRDRSRRLGKRGVVVVLSLLLILCIAASSCDPSGKKKKRKRKNEISMTTHAFVHQQI